MDYSVPTDWIAAAGLKTFRASALAYRCEGPHVLIRLNEIQPIKRDRPLDQNGFVRDRMMAVLRGIRDNDSMPPVPVWRTIAGPWCFEIRDGYHRLYASQALGFSHIPADIGERY
jgi:hypothetical protein